MASYLNPSSHLPCITTVSILTSTWLNHLTFPPHSKETKGLNDNDNFENGNHLWIEDYQMNYSILFIRLKVPIILSPPQGSVAVAICVPRQHSELWRWIIQMREMGKEFWIRFTACCYLERDIISQMNFLCFRLFQY